MSAFIVDKSDIDQLVSAALHARPGGHPGDTRELSWWRVDESGEYCGWNQISLYAEQKPGDDYKQFVTPSTLGQILVNENVASVSHRYPNDDADAGELPSPCDAYYVGPYIYEEPRVELTPGAVFRLIDCLDYQSCEHEGWRRSEAYAFLQALRKVWCDRVINAEREQVA